MAAARTLLSDVGAEGVSMRAVALGAGVTPGATYRHFPNKDALVRRVVAEAFEKLESQIGPSLAKFPVGAFERIGELGRMYIAFARTNPADYRLLFAPRGENRPPVELEPGFGPVRVLEQCVRDCIAAGVMADHDPRLIALLLWSRMHGLISLFLSFDFSKEYPGLDLETGLETVADTTRSYLLDGLRRR